VPNILNFWQGVPNILGFMGGVLNTLQSDGGSNFPEGVLDFLGKIALGVLDLRGCQFSCDTGTSIKVRS